MVQIGQYDLYKINIDKEWTSRIPERLNIKVVDCEYSFEKGFSKRVLEENKSITVEEKKDEFTNFSRGKDYENNWYYDLLLHRLQKKTLVFL